MSGRVVGRDERADVLAQVVELLGRAVDEREDNLVRRGHDGCGDS